MNNSPTDGLESQSGQGSVQYIVIVAGIRPGTLGTYQVI